jgi:hypothetical protein
MSARYNYSNIGSERVLIGCSDNWVNTSTPITISIYEGSLSNATVTSNALTRDENIVLHATCTDDAALPLKNVYFYLYKVAFGSWNETNTSTGSNGLHYYTRQATATGIWEYKAVYCQDYYGVWHNNLSVGINITVSAGGGGGGGGGGGETYEPQAVVPVCNNNELCEEGETNKNCPMDCKIDLNYFNPLANRNLFKDLFSMKSIIFWALIIVVGGIIVLSVPNKRKVNA